jgi:pimeloyl-ACP methyl ester carboxylesterase
VVTSISTLPPDASATSAQPAEVFPDGFTRITLLCRGHDGSDLGDPARLSIAQFAADALALMDHLGLQTLPMGGISLGAAIALRLAVTHPDRVQALILARPAWVDHPAPATMQSYAEVARQLDRHGEIGRALFQSGKVYRDLSLASPDNAASLVTFFTRARPDTTVALLQSIPLDGPGVTRAQIAALPLPTLVLTTGQDSVHPAAYGQDLAALIPHAILTDLPAKGRDKPAHVAAFRAALAQFLSAQT